MIYTAIALIPIGLAMIVYAFVGEVPDPAGLQFIGGATATGGALTWVVYRALWPEPKPPRAASAGEAASVDPDEDAATDGPGDGDATDDVAGATPRDAG